MLSPAPPNRRGQGVLSLSHDSFRPENARCTHRTWNRSMRATRPSHGKGRFCPRPIRLYGWLCDRTNAVLHAWQSVASRNRQGTARRPSLRLCVPPPTPTLSGNRFAPRVMSEPLICGLRLLERSPLAREWKGPVDCPGAVHSLRFLRTA